MFTTDKTFTDLDEALKADPKDGRLPIRVTAERSATTLYNETITLDLAAGRISESRAEKERASYLAWSNGRTPGCVPASVGSIPTASTNSEEENEKLVSDNETQVGGLDEAPVLELHTQRGQPTDGEGPATL